MLLAAAHVQCIVVAPLPPRRCRRAAAAAPSRCLARDRKTQNRKRRKCQNVRLSNRVILFHFGIFHAIFPRGFGLRFATMFRHSLAELYSTGVQRPR